MIIPLIIIGIIIIIWLQYPDVKEDNTEPVYKKIFNRIKLPTIFICIISIIYLLLCKNKDNISESYLNTQKVFMSNPEL